MRRELTGTPPSARPSKVHEDERRDREEAALRIELDSIKARLARDERRAAEGRAKRLLDIADGYANEKNAVRGEVEMLRWMARDLESWRDVIRSA